MASTYVPDPTAVWSTLRARVMTSIKRKLNYFNFDFTEEEKWFILNEIWNVYGYEPRYYNGDDGMDWWVDNVQYDNPAHQPIIMSLWNQVQDPTFFGDYGTMTREEIMEADAARRRQLQPIIDELAATKIQNEDAFLTIQVN